MLSTMEEIKWESSSLHCDLLRMLKQDQTREALAPPRTQGNSQQFAAGEHNQTLRGPQTTNILFTKYPDEYRGYIDMLSCAC